MSSALHDNDTETDTTPWMLQVLCLHAVPQHPGSGVATMDAVFDFNNRHAGHVTGLQRAERQALTGADLTFGICQGS